MCILSYAGGREIGLNIGGMKDALQPQRPGRPEKRLNEFNPTTSTREKDANIPPSLSRSNQPFRLVCHELHATPNSDNNYSSDIIGRSGNEQ